MKTKNLAIIATATLMLAVTLASSSPAYAVTSVAVSREQAKNGPGDTFKDDGTDPAYADRVVDGILSPPPSEMTMVYVTQESAAAQQPVSPVSTTTTVQKIYIPVQTPALAQDDTNPPVQPSPRTEAPAALSTQQPSPALPPTQESVIAVPQVLGVSTEKDSLNPVISADLKIVLAQVQKNQTILQNLIQVGLLLFMVMIPFLAINLFLQVKMFSRINRRTNGRPDARPLKKK